jgi:hypothetical protein
MNQGVIEGQKVFALGNISIGYIAEVYANSSKVVLFSNPGEKTEVVISLGSLNDSQNGTLPIDEQNGRDVFMQLVGRGGGNFEIVLPKSIILPNGTEAVLPGITPYVLGTVQATLSDSRDSFQKALLSIPINIQELKFVEVEK